MFYLLVISVIFIWATASVIGWVYLKNPNSPKDSLLYSAILAGVAFIMLLLTNVLSNNYSYEFWRGKLVSTSYKKSYTETRIVTDGNGHTRTELIYHPPEWWVDDTNGQRVYVTEEHYINLAKQWGVDKPVTENFWWGELFKLVKDVNTVPATTDVYCTTRHIYKNNTQANNSVYKYTKPSPEQITQLGLFERPVITDFYYCPCVLGAKDSEKLQQLNADYGKKYQVNVFLLVFNNKPIDSAIQQEAYWEGGAKNDLVLCVNLNAVGTIDWAKAFSWSESEHLKAEFKDKFTGTKYDADKISEWLRGTIPTKWERKQFKDFNYISVDASLLQVVFTLIAYIFCCGVIFWACKNNILG